MLEAIGAARRTVNLLTYIYWRGEIARDVADALCERATAAGRVPRPPGRRGLGQDGPDLVARMEDAGRLRAPLPPAQALRHPARQQPHPPQAPGGRRAGGLHRRASASPTSGPATRRTPTTGATPTCASRGPVVRGLQGAVRRELARGDRRGAGRRGRPARARPRGRRRRADAARALQRRRRRHERRDALLPHDRLRPASDRHDVGLLRAPARPSRPRWPTRPRAGSRVRVLVPGPHIDKDVVRAAARSIYGQLLAGGRAASSSTSRRCSTRSRWWSTARGRPSARRTSTTARSS